MGNGLFATADIKVGEDVVHAKVPFVAVLDTPRLVDTCSGCFGKKQMEGGTELKACTGCRTVRYCDRVSCNNLLVVLMFCMFCDAVASFVSSSHLSMSGYGEGLMPRVLASKPTMIEANTLQQTCQSKDWKFAHSQECSIFQKLAPEVLPNNARALLRMVLRTDKGKYNAQELGIFSNLETHIREIQDVESQKDRITLTAKAVKDYSKTGMTEQAVTAYAARVSVL